MHIVKRKGHKEKFDERKVYGSVYAACLSAHIHDEKAEEIASKISKNIIEWVKKEDEVTSYQIFVKVGRLLEEENKEAAFMYLTHRDIS